MSSIAEFRLGYNIFVITASGFLYFKCITTLRRSRAIDRKRLLTFVFAANLLSWVLIVMPHLIFFYFLAHHFNFAVFMEHLFLLREVLAQPESLTDIFFADYSFSVADVEGVKE